MSLGHVDTSRVAMCGVGMEAKAGNKVEVGKTARGHSMSLLGGAGGCLEERQCEEMSPQPEYSQCVELPDSHGSSSQICGWIFKRLDNVTTVNSPSGSVC